jgi:2-polyprenyl-3-methyl-5-hydroxy-6-metoxy-1,4-benzoquinol methylase
MKKLDVYLQDVRIKKAGKFIRKGDSVLDIGTHDGVIFRKLNKLITTGTGIDPALSQITKQDNYTLYPGYFPKACPPGITYDVITMLAVLEHLPAKEQLQLGSDCAQYLNKNGRVIITVPSPQVDRILEIFIKLRIIDGMDTDQHYGFEPENTLRIFDSRDFKLLYKERFQFGLNNLFVFEKI